MCRWKTIIYTCGHASPHPVFLNSCNYEREIERYEAFRMRRDYRNTIKKEAALFEFVLDLRHKCVREESFMEEFSQVKCKDCVDEEGWGYAKTGYFKELENKPHKAIDHCEQEKEKAIAEKKDCAAGDMMSNEGCKEAKKPEEKENGG